MTDYCIRKLEYQIQSAAESSAGSHKLFSSTQISINLHEFLLRHNNEKLEILIEKSSKYFKLTIKLMTFMLWSKHIGIFKQQQEINMQLYIKCFPSLLYIYIRKLIIKWSIL